MKPQLLESMFEGTHEHSSVKTPLASHHAQELSWFTKHELLSLGNASLRFGFSSISEFKKIV